MIHLREHIPGFIELGGPRQADAETTKQLVAIPWVRAWLGVADDAHFVISDDTLMVECTRYGRPWWWVIGYLSGELVVELPRWVGSRQQENEHEGHP